MVASAREALSKATCLLEQKGIDNPRLEAELLLEDTLGLQKTELYLDSQLSLSSTNTDLFWRAVQARLQRKPLQHILGNQPFRKLNLKVHSGVFIPRSETELLVEHAISAIRARFERKESVIFIDVGTGTGAIALSLAYELPNAHGWAVDVSKIALSLAQENAQLNKVEDKVTCVESNLFNRLGQDFYGKMDLVISNPPYVRKSEINSLQTEVKDFEPHGALDGGRDGLHFHREIVTSAPLFLKEEGILALEIGEGQAEEVTNMIKRTGRFSGISAHKDYSGIDRVIIASRV